MMNLKNDHWIAQCLQDVPILMKTKHPVHIMLIKVSKSMVMLCLHSSTHVASDNTKENIKCLEEVVLP